MSMGSKRSRRRLQTTGLGSTNRHRNELHKSHLPAFANWLAEEGWRTEEPKGDYEVLRARNAEGAFVAFYAKPLPTQHVTTFGKGTQLAHAFLRDKRKRDAQDNQRPR